MLPRTRANSGTTKLESAPAALSLQGARRFEFIKISGQFESASARLQDAIRIVGHDFPALGFRSPRQYRNVKLLIGEQDAQSFITVCLGRYSANAHS
jgi:hypothetical protein